jgi:hypothetical protein
VLVDVGKRRLILRLLGPGARHQQQGERSQNERCARHH